MIWYTNSCSIVDTNLKLFEIKLHKYRYCYICLRLLVIAYCIACWYGCRLLLFWKKKIEWKILPSLGRNIFVSSDFWFIYLDIAILFLFAMFLDSVFIPDRKKFNYYQYEYIKNLIYLRHYSVELLSFLALIFVLRRKSW